MMTAALILNPIVFFCGPILVGFVYGFVYTASITESVIVACKLDKNCCLCCLISPWIFLFILCLILPLTIAAGAICSALLTGIGSPLFMLYIIFFAAKLIVLNCKTFK